MGFTFAGLSPDETIEWEVCINVLVLPGINGVYAELAKPMPVTDEFALELAWTIMNTRPLCGAYADNGLGDWMKAAVKALWDNRSAVLGLARHATNVASLVPGLAVPAAIAGVALDGAKAMTKSSAKRKK
jgi:hypothetical protein